MPNTTVSVSTENGPIAVQPPTSSMLDGTVKRSMKRKAEMGSTLVPDATVSVSTGNCPIIAQPPTNSMPEIIVKRATKRKAYVLVPRAPYRYRFPDQDSDTRRGNQANSSASAPLETQVEVQHPLDSHEQRTPPLQVQVNCEATILKPSTLSLSDIGISIPTTVRKPGSFIMHTPQIIPHNRILAEETASTERLAKPVNPPTTRPYKPPHVANPVTAQVITKGSLAPLKFNKSKPSKVRSMSSFSNDTIIVASTSTQGSSSLPQLQPTPPPVPLPEAANVSSSTELTAREIADAVINRFGFMLCQKVSDCHDLFFK